MWEPEKLARQLECVEQAGQDVVCVFTGFRRFGPGVDGQVDGQVELPARATFTPAEHILHWRLHPSTAMVRRGRSPRFTEWTQHAEDLLYFAELSAAGPFAAVPAPLVRVRSSPLQQTRSVAHLVGAHASRCRWAKASALFSHDELLSILEDLDEGLLEQMAIKKWRRDWPRYWAIRRYLAEVRPSLRDRPEIHERIGPAWAYRVKDHVDGLLRRAGHRRVAS